jgi:hypothetical protein
MLHGDTDLNTNSLVMISFSRRSLVSGISYMWNMRQNVHSIFSYRNVYFLFTELWQQEQPHYANRRENKDGWRARRRLRVGASISAWVEPQSHIPSRTTKLLCTVTPRRWSLSLLWAASPRAYPSTCPIARLRHPTSLASSCHVRNMYLEKWFPKAISETVKDSKWLSRSHYAHQPENNFQLSNTSRTRFCPHVIIYRSRCTEGKSYNNSPSYKHRTFVKTCVKSIVRKSPFIFP